MQGRHLTGYLLQWVLVAEMIVSQLLTSTEGLQEEFIDAQGKMQLGLDYLQLETIHSTCR